MFAGWNRPWIALALLATVLFQAAAGWGAEERKVKSKVEPVYPEIARRMHVSGTVRLEFVIAADGQVKKIHALGGHPVLIRAATNALKAWRYERGPETTAIVVFHFKP